MHAMTQEVVSSQDAIVEDSMMFAGEGTELFGCYTLAAGSMHSGAGTELLGCYTQRAGTSHSGAGSELYGCYTA